MCHTKLSINVNSGLGLVVRYVSNLELRPLLKKVRHSQVKVRQDKTKERRQDKLRPDKTKAKQAKTA